MHPAYAAPETRTFTVMITSQGFDEGSLNITVNQGDTVKITFELDASQAANTDPSNHHVISISGYQVSTAEISPSNPSASVTFVASTTGSFLIYCASPECPIHYLMVSGNLQVVPPGVVISTTTTTLSGSSGSGTSVAVSPTISATSTSQVQSTSATSSMASHSTTTTAAPPGSTAHPGGLSFGGLSKFAILAFAFAFLAGVLVTSKFVVEASH